MKKIFKEPLVCKLSGPEFAKRKAALQGQVFKRIIKKDELADGYKFYFKHDENFLIRMLDYVIAENKCCPFFTFGINLHGEEDVILKITGPNEEAKKLVEELLN